MLYESNQDFATTMARIQGITLQGNQAWRATYQRSFFNANQASFERYLHQAMGYKASTVQDWA